MITVLMAARTSTEYMPQAIGSLLGQSYTDWQLIIGVNGHSSLGELFDQACRYVEPWQEQMVVWDLPSCKNKAEALNEMVSHVGSDSDYVAILDVDDLWHPLKLEKQIRAVECDVGCDVCGTLGRYFDDCDNDIGVPSGRVHYSDLQKGNCLINSSVVMARKLAHWEPMDEPIEDYDLWLRLARDGHYLYNLPEHLTFIRQHAGNWSKQGNHEAALARLRARYA